MTLFISHLPKTSGVSLRALVERHNPDAVLIYNDELAWKTLDLSFVKTVREMSPPSAIMGHFPFGTHRLFGLPPRYTTMLREPVSRIISLYRFAKSLPQSSLGEDMGPGMSLREFVENRVTRMTNNHACRMIAGVAPEAPGLYRDPWLLGYAMHNLRNHYCLVGITERSGPYVAQLAAELNWPEAGLPRLNVTSGDDVEPDAETLEIIRDHNALDIQLYEAVASGAFPMPGAA